MSEQSLDQISSIVPSDFFSFEIPLMKLLKKGLSKEVRKRRAELPSLSEFHSEKPFAKVHMGWHISGLAFYFEIKEAFQESSLPNFRRGDCIELFIDTRDLKSAGFVTQFCHHFLIFPVRIDGVIAEEITSFRTEDRHELCSPDKIEVDAKVKTRGVEIEIFIPSECLHGYDPRMFKRLGFSYRINREKKTPQHFAVSSNYLSIEQQPSLWSSMNLEG